ncbi:MAG: type II toxin-antitoxin system RatA family toxin [Wenzhouxiangella sp.]|nr:type II toxin-antitoxin system RatA family toxin [Wenzhouxiangella sp.]MCH8477815.1 type II toxin-antitoxin system RatA family toxin [Wenzhouxiangella sp.]TVR93163.1 MAG: type II toxin-antitoxin system RatA family toxin [Wenzhouxiangellaceae bacterium]
MQQVHRFALVTHSPQQMYELVRDVARYPEFLNWVQAATVHEEDDERQLATLKVRIAGMSQTFTTENRLESDRRLEMQLRAGPFERLSGAWRFEALGELGTRVSLDLEFALAGSALMLPFRRGFNRMADRMVDDFCRRAEALYGG